MYVTKKSTSFFLFAATILILSSCTSYKTASKDYLYFKEGNDSLSIQTKQAVIKPNDLLEIKVFSNTLNQEQAAIFNMTGPSEKNTIQGYEVNVDGNIIFPVLGKIKAAGYTKEQLQEWMVKKLAEYVKAPSVMVRFLHYTINILGEVKLPGTHTFIVDRVTIIDALSAAGDLTDYGKRDDITVIREEKDKRITYTVDLRNKNIFSSPAYILQPNDIVYVSPTKNKIRNLNVNPDAQRKTGLFFSIIATVTSIASIIVFATRD